MGWILACSCLEEECWTCLGRKKGEAEAGEYKRTKGGKAAVGARGPTQQHWRECGYTSPDLRSTNWKTNDKTYVKEIIKKDTYCMLLVDVIDQLRGRESPRTWTG